MSSPTLDGYAASPTLSDHGYHPGLSGPDLAIGRALTMAQAQWSAQINQMQTSQRLIEVQLQQQSEFISHLLAMSQPQPRRQGRPHPGKSMRAEKRRRKQALLEQANSSASDGASDADGTMAAAAAAAAAASPAPTADMPPATAASHPLAAASVVAAAAAPEGEGAGTESPALDVLAAAVVEPEESTKTSPASALARSQSLDAAAAAPPVDQNHQIDEGWFDVAAQVESSATSSRTGTPQQVLAPSLSEANRELAKAAAEAACAKLLEAMRQQHIEQMCSTNEALSALKAEMLQQLRSHQQSTEEVLCSIPSKEDLATTCDGLKQQMQHAQQDLGHHLADEIQALKQQNAEEALAAQQAFKVQLAAFKEEMLQEMRFEQQRGVEVLKEEQRQEAADMRAALMDRLAPLASLQSEHQSDFRQLRHELQEAQRKNEELHADSARHIRPLRDELAAMQPQIADLMDKITELTTASLQGSSQQRPRSQELAEAAVVITADAGADADQLATQDLPPPPGLSVAPAAGQTETPAPMQTEEAVSEAAAVTAAASASLTALAPRTLPPRCRVVACYWYKGSHTGNAWQLGTERELAEPFVVTATTLGDVKVKAAKALGFGSGDYFTELKNFDGSRSVPSQDQEERRSLQDLGRGEGSLLKLHFRNDNFDSIWWSYEVIGSNSH